MARTSESTTVTFAANTTHRVRFSTPIPPNLESGDEVVLVFSMGNKRDKQVRLNFAEVQALVDAKNGDRY